MSIFPTKILLATDGSEEATLATQTATDLADKTNSELHVVYVGELDYGYPSYVIPDPEYMQSVQEKLTQEARKVLDAEVEQVKAAGASVVEAHLSMGSPDVEIVKLAEEIGAGLVVMGSRGLGRIRRALIGSVSDSVVRHAHCPVLIVRREEDVQHYPQDYDSATRRHRGEKGEGLLSLWEKLFSDQASSERRRKVLKYIIHRINDGAHLRDVVQEEYVRRNASPGEVETIIENPRLVEAARKAMEEDFSRRPGSA